MPYLSKFTERDIDLGRVDHEPSPRSFLQDRHGHDRRAPHDTLNVQTPGTITGRPTGRPDPVTTAPDDAPPAAASVSSARASLTHPAPPTCAGGDGCTAPE